MDMRSLGSEGLAVSAIGLGGMALSSVYHPIDDEGAHAVIDRAIEFGVTHFDTADVYGAGHNERLFGRALRGHRRSVIVASKIGQRPNAEDGRIVNGSPEYVHAACDASLDRLGFEFIDLLYLHRIDPQVPIEETVGAMGELVAAGKVRYIGLSEAAPATIRRANATHPITAVQTEYSLWTRFVEADTLPLCEELGIGFVAYSPLGRGFLTGTIKDEADLSAEDGRRRHPRFQSDAIAHNAKLLEALQDTALDHGASSSQIALAWVLAQGAYIVPIPSTTSVQHLDENTAATHLELTSEEVSRLNSVFRLDSVVGDRYPERMLKTVQR